MLQIFALIGVKLNHEESARLGKVQYNKDMNSQALQRYDKVSNKLVEASSCFFF